MKVVLMGYMASGKSTILGFLETKNYQTIDLDKYIEDKIGLSVSKIFQNHGEIFFRKVEKESLEEILLDPSWAGILSLGGGTPCYYQNISTIKKYATSFFLQCSPSDLAERIYQHRQTRPLVKDKTQEEITEYVAKHLFERNPFYLQADYVLQTKDKSFEEIAQEIVEKSGIKSLD
ncbi:MAG: shikimate kinase [Flavobacteriaceae bacterium]|nr:MAG: shikimate kinase [Flavobacteriaceae bacterium]